MKYLVLYAIIFNISTVCVKFKVEMKAPDRGQGPPRLKSQDLTLARARITDQHRNPAQAKVKICIRVYKLRVVEEGG